MRRPSAVWVWLILHISHVSSLDLVDTIKGIYCRLDPPQPGSPGLLQRYCEQPAASANDTECNECLEREELLLEKLTACRLNRTATPPPPSTPCPPPDCPPPDCPPPRECPPPDCPPSDCPPPPACPPHECPPPPPPVKCPPPQQCPPCECPPPPKLDCKDCPVQEKVKIETKTIVKNCTTEGTQLFRIPSLEWVLIETQHQADVRVKQGILCGVAVAAFFILWLATVGVKTLFFPSKVEGKSIATPQAAFRDGDFLQQSQNRKEALLYERLETLDKKLREGLLSLEQQDTNKAAANTNGIFVQHKRKKSKKDPIADTPPSSPSTKQAETPQHVTTSDLLQSITTLIIDRYLPFVDHSNANAAAQSKAIHHLLQALEKSQMNDEASGKTVETLSKDLQESVSVLKNISTHQYGGTISQVEDAARLVQQTGQVMQQRVKDMEAVWKKSEDAGVDSIMEGRRLVGTLRTAMQQKDTEIMQGKQEIRRLEKENADLKKRGK